MPITFDDLPAASSKLSFDDLPDSGHGLKFDDLPDTEVSPEQGRDVLNATAQVWNAATGTGSLAQANAVMDESASDDAAKENFWKDQPNVTETPTFAGELKKGIQDFTVRGTYNHLRKAGSIAYDTLRKPLSPLLGPTESERIADAVPVTDKDGNVTYEYRPAGDRMAKEAGLMTSFLPMKPFESKEGDSTLDSTVKAAGNILQGVVGSFLSPLGVATAGSASLPNATRVIGGTFAADMGAHIPGQIEQGLNGKTLQERIEGWGGALVGSAFGALGTREAIRGRPKAEDITQYIRTNLEKMQAEAPQTVGKGEFRFIPSETLDGLHVARERLRDGFEDQTPEIQAQRQEYLDSIDDQLFAADPQARRESEVRVSQRDQSPSQESTPVSEPSATGGPSDTGSRSALFEQAKRESTEIPPENPNNTHLSDMDAAIKEFSKIYPEDAKLISDELASGELKANVVGGVADAAKNGELRKDMDVNFDSTKPAGSDEALAISRLQQFLVKDNLHGQLGKLEADKPNIDISSRVGEFLKAEARPRDLSGIDPEIVSMYEKKAREISEREASGQPDIIKEKAYDAAFDNAIGSLKSGKDPTIKFMRQSAQEAAGKAVKKQPVSIDAGEAPLVERTSAPVVADNSEPISAMNQAIDKALSPRDAEIVRDIQTMSMEEAGLKHNLSKTRISQIANEAYSKIRAEMERSGVTKDDVEFAERDRTTGQSSIPEELRTDPEVEAILSGAMSDTYRGMGRKKLSEAGAIFGSGGGKVPLNPLGSTPRGDVNFIRIESALKRLPRGLLTDGAADVLAKSENVVGKALSKAIRRHVDVEQEIHGQLVSELNRATKGMSAKAVKKAIDELEPYLAAKENKRPLPAIGSNAKAILDAWQNIAETTGKLSQAHNVQVYDPSTGGYRPMNLIGKDYVPRMFRQEVQQVLGDPRTNPKLFNKLADELAAHRGITPEEAAKELRGVSSRFRSSDYLGNIEMARTGQLPESFYDYNIGNLISKYVPAFSERMGQIIAYGQRLGPREAPLVENLWDVAMKEAEDPRTQDWLREAEDQSINLRAKSGMLKAAQQAQTLASGLLLASPTTSVVRNMLSGLAATTEILGAKRAAANMIKAATSAQAHMDAKEIGAIRDNIGDFLHADQLADNPLDTAIRGTTNQMLKYSFYNGSENFVRTHAAITASQFAKDGVKAINKNPKSGLAKEALGMFKRIGVDAKKVVSEGADWKTGPETRKFIRTIIRDTQGGYRFDQVPLWANGAVGRFAYQFGRYGTQRSRNIWNNGIKPAIGEEIEWNGKKMVNRDVKPLIKMAISSVLLGEAFTGVTSVLFDRDRRDASLKEIAEAFTEDQKQGIALASERLINDIIASGTLGVWGQPVDFVKSLKDQSRFKNPAEPPSMASGKAVVGLAQNFLDQGTVTKKDMLNFASQLVPGVKQLSDLARNVLDEPLYEAENDVKTLRAAGTRWAQANKIDVPKRASGGDLRKSANAPTYEPIYEALLTGDADTARLLASQFANKQKDREKTLRNLKLSVKSRQPFRVGPFTNGEYKGEFMKWASKNLPDEDYEQVKRIQGRYEASAKKAGLW